MFNFILYVLTHPGNWISQNNNRCGTTVTQALASGIGGGGMGGNGYVQDNNLQIQQDEVGQWTITINNLGKNGFISFANTTVNIESSLNSCPSFKTFSSSSSNTIQGNVNRAGVYPYTVAWADGYGKIYYKESALNVQHSGGDGEGGGGGNPCTETMFEGVKTAACLGNVALTVLASIDGSLHISEDVYGPFEDGFNVFAMQGDIMRAVTGNGCAIDIPGGIDTHTAEQMLAHGCNVTLPRFDSSGNRYSLLDACGGHTQEYHFHERLKCLYDSDDSSVHSPKLATHTDGTYSIDLYGKWEGNGMLPQLDYCGGHFGPVPGEIGEKYHNHIQTIPPFTFGCYGPATSNSFVTREQCRGAYPNTCDDGDEITIELPTKTITYDPYCPCFDATGSNTGNAPRHEYAPPPPPQQCTQNSDCQTSHHTCCNWDNVQGLPTNGVCAEVCTSTFVQPPTSCEETSDFIIVGAGAGGSAAAAYMRQHDASFLWFEAGDDQSHKLQDFAAYTSESMPTNNYSPTKLVKTDGNEMSYSIPQSAGGMTAHYAGVNFWTYEDTKKSLSLKADEMVTLEFVRGITNSKVHCDTYNPTYHTQARSPNGLINETEFMSLPMCMYGFCKNNDVAGCKINKYFVKAYGVDGTNDKSDISKWHRNSAFVEYGNSGLQLHSKIVDLKLNGTNVTGVYVKNTQTNTIRLMCANKAVLLAGGVMGNAPILVPHIGSYKFFGQPVLTYYNSYSECDPNTLSGGTLHRIRQGGNKGFMSTFGVCKNDNGDTLMLWGTPQAVNSNITGTIQLQNGEITAEINYDDTISTELQEDFQQTVRQIFGDHTADNLPNINPTFSSAAYHWTGHAENVIKSKIVGLDNLYAADAMGVTGVTRGWTSFNARVAGATAAHRALVNTNTIHAIQDPHITFANGGGTADFRGMNNTLYNFVSSPNFAVNLKTEFSDFYLKKLLVHGSFFTEAHIVSSKSSRISVWSDKIGNKNTIWVNGTCDDKPFKIGVHRIFKCKDDIISTEYSTMSVNTLDWTIKVVPTRIYDRVRGPFVRLDVSFGKKTHVPSHGIVGQSYMSSKPVFGKRDVYPESGEFTTKAMAEGAIEGDASEYKVNAKYNTDFKYSKFESSFEKRPPQKVQYSKTT
jgi:hypothetical protein